MFHVEQFGAPDPQSCNALNSGRTCYEGRLKTADDSIASRRLRQLPADALCMLDSFAG